jgi:hypothetical protein
VFYFDSFPVDEELFGVVVGLVTGLTKQKSQPNIPSQMT